MKGFAMLKIGATGWIEKEIPKCGPMDAICKPLALAPCTSDIHTVWAGAIGERSNMILGHEAVGEVVEVGTLVRDFKVGDKVLVSAITPDWNSRQAQEGFAMHSGGMLSGWKFSNFKDGVFAEYFHVNDADGNLAHLPEGMDLAAAAIRGAAGIYAVGSRKNCCDLAMEFGATQIINYRSGGIVEQIMEKTHGMGVDKVIVAGGDNDTFAQAMEIVKPGGIIGNVNYLGEGDTVGIPRLAWGCGMGHKQLRGGLMPGGRLRSEKLARLVMENRIHPEKLITHRFTGLESVEPALMLMKDKPKNLIKPLVVME